MFTIFCTQVLGLRVNIQVNVAVYPAILSCSRGNQTSHSYIFSNEEGMVSDTSYFPGLGSSYHICIRFKLNCYSERSEDKLPRLNLHKADYVKMR